MVDRTVGKRDLIQHFIVDAFDDPGTKYRTPGRYKELTRTSFAHARACVLKTRTGRLLSLGLAQVGAGDVMLAMVIGRLTISWCNKTRLSTVCTSAHSCSGRYTVPGAVTSLHSGID